jgi:pSer/pThr/pTyr-binding forkhead associated (FHA) protein/ribosomal protein L37AE/L43A
MQKKIIGRDTSCDYIIFDPQNRVSRKHAELFKDHSHFFIKDLNSLNGIYVNGKKIIPGNLIKLGSDDKITFSKDYVLDIKMVFGDDDATKILSSNSDSDSSIVFDNKNAIYRDKKQTVVFDRDKTQFSDILQMDTSPFVSIGRNSDNKITINNNNVSKYHCMMRLLTPVMIELEDMGSTNGTYADDEKLTPNKRYQFASSVRIRLGSSYALNLKTVFPDIQIIQKAVPAKPDPQAIQPSLNAPITKKELEAFIELESVWKEYIGRQNQANKTSTGYSIGGAVFGLAAAAFTGATGGIGGMLLMTGGGILGRYLGQQESSKIRNNLTFEDAFLQTYACPRCQESFQKKPWITIRECFKCKIKFR